MGHFSNQTKLTQIRGDTGNPTYLEIRRKREREEERQTEKRDYSTDPILFILDAARAVVGCSGRRVAWCSPNESDMHVRLSQNGYSQYSANKFMRIIYIIRLQV